MRLHLRLHALDLDCRHGASRIEFSHHVTFIHGEYSTGKSSVARLIDFCLGNELKRTLALEHELVTVGLHAAVGEYEALFEREAVGSRQVRVSWTAPDGDVGMVLAPLQAGDQPILGESIYTLSDLLFFFWGTEPPKVRQSKVNDETPLVRLSFRDLMWYCYLKQEELELSFFHLADEGKMWKSRDVMRYVLGYLTERMQEIEADINAAQEERRAKAAAAAEVRQLLARVGYETSKSLQDEGELVDAKLSAARTRLSALRENYRSETHIADELRATARRLGERLATETDALAAVTERLSQQRSLRAECITAKLKAGRSSAASELLANVRFAACPACNRPVSWHDGDPCYLCKGEGPVLSDVDDDALLSARSSSDAILQRDLADRIDDLDQAVRRSERAIREQAKRVEAVGSEKLQIDRRLNETLADYDSAYLARFRSVEQEVGTLEERRRNLARFAQLEESASESEQEAGRLAVRIEQLKREHAAERSRLRDVDENRRAVEEAYLEALLAVGVQGVGRADAVSLDLRTWIPQVLTDGDPMLPWDFFKAGSGGKPTLMTVCYGLAVHQAAELRGLPLPTILIIDSPTKNIRGKVNSETLRRLIGHIYGVAGSDLKDTQIIIIDEDFVPPDDPELDVESKLFHRTDPKHPPLIPYYGGA